jgi:hypothetical protein
MSNDSLESIKNCIVFSPRDWSLDKRDAWMYGIVVGWDNLSLYDLSIRHGWSVESVARLRQLRNEFEQYTQES